MEKSATKRIARNISWLLGGNSLSGLILLVATVYAARVLGAGGFGSLSFAQAFLVYLVLVVDSGLSIFGTRQIAQNRARAAGSAANILLLRTIMAVIVFGLSSLFLFFAPLGASMRSLFLVTFFFVFYRALNADWVFQGLEVMQYNAYARLLFSFLVIIFTLGLVRSGNDLIVYAGILSFSGIAVSLLFIYWLFKKIVKLEPGSLAPGSWWKIFTLSLPLGASMIMVQIYNNLDTIMLGFMDRAEVVGYYNAAYKVFYVLVGGFVLWQATAVPVMSARILTQADRATGFLQKYVRLTMLLAIPAVVLIALAAPQLVTMVFGQEYNAGGYALRLLIFSFIPLTLGSTYGILILVPAGRFYQFFWAVAVGALVNIGLNFILIPSFSMYGAAVATIAAESSAAAVAFFLSKDIMRIGLAGKLIKPLLVSFLAGLGYLIAGFFLPTLPSGFSVLLSSLAYLLITVIVIAVVERGFMQQFIEEIFKARSADQLAG